MNQVTKTAGTALTTLADMGFNPEDIMLPKILLLQSTSALVQEGKAANGDIIDSLNGTKLGDKNTPLEVVPVSPLFKTWTTLEKGSAKFVKSEPYTGKEKPYDESLSDGRAVTNFLTFNFYVLPVKSFEAGNQFAALISFKSKSLKAGKLFNTQIMQTQMAVAPVYAKTIMLGCTFTKNDKGAFYVYTVAQGKATSPKLKEAAQMWANTLTSKAVKVDETEDAPVEEVDSANSQY